MNQPSFLGKRQLDEYRRAVALYPGSKVREKFLVLVSSGFCKSSVKYGFFVPYRVLLGTFLQHYTIVCASAHDDSDVNSQPSSTTLSVYIMHMYPFLYTYRST